MKKNDVTLTDIFLREHKELDDATNRQLTKNGHIRQLQKKIDESGHANRMPAIVDKVSAYMEDILDISLEGILVSGWKKYATIAEALERSKKSPQKTIYLSLSKHKIVSEHHPHIEIYLNEKMIEKIVFDIKLQLTLEGFVLEIKNGEVAAVETGKCGATGRMTYKDIILFEKKSQKIELPGKLVLV